ncbi:LuxR C-terminal-related transcriptional regulator [Prauserella sp. PE36]|uniref:LuxR C-terminal-related transcriptional regulator n=1 Tax=Prauserella sp. PE36 TaxID=1504709 RepID=UPI001F31A532|nr:LuxR C-terminal-related transcriptional regulator [Prauserella sp. PE36]
MTTSMSMPSAVQAVVSRGVRELHRATALPVAFGGIVARDQRSFVISQLSGALTESLLRLRVDLGSGLGGKALALVRPAAVSDYFNADEITHTYDRAVAPERLHTALAIPIRVGPAPAAMLYAASREPVVFGDRVLRSAVSVARQVERDIAVEQEVHRRLGAVARERVELDQVRAELDAIAGLVTGQARERLRAVSSRVGALAGDGRAAGRPGAGTVSLTPRETEVLALVARGEPNRAIGEELGLLTNTVKAYLKSAMRKLGAANRVQAVCRAREAGLVD